MPVGSRLYGRLMQPETRIAETPATKRTLPSLLDTN